MADMIHKHENREKKMSLERIRWEFQRSFYSFRRGPALALIPLEIAALLLVSAKGAGKIYMDLLPILIGITVLSCFLVTFIHGNQRILLFALTLLTVGTMLQSIFRQEAVLKHPELYTGRSPAASLQLQYMIGLVLAILAGILYWNLRSISSIKIAEILTVASFLISFATLILAKSVGNVRNWIVIGGFSFQTTEIVKFLYLFIAAALLGTVEKPDKARLTAFYLISFMEMGFLVIQSEFGTLLLILMVFLTFLFLFVEDFKIFLGTVFSMAIAVFMVVTGGMQLEKLVATGSKIGSNALVRAYLSNYHKILNRFVYWMHPEKDSLGQGYQLLKAKESIVLGGWFGTSSITDLPVKTSDLVFPALIQRCGMIFALLVFLVFILLWMEGMKVCVKKTDKYHCMMAVGLVSMFIDQTIIIIAGSTGLCPLTGITLPFISSGGSSLVISFVLVSLLLCISGNISWKGQNSEKVKFFEKSTDCAERVFAFGYRHVRIFVQNLGSHAGNLRRSRSEEGGGQTERI
ncbi:MAG: FtsW/RodA/SpoVE family cell cycle protein [Eubacteriales bacterium]|nr:FtsW/RodA/SpoVE family cell cycle protein [Eubacteriales bacterium]